MRSISRTSQFKQDFKRLVKRGKDPELLKFVISSLANGEKLAENQVDHSLAGGYKGFRECHIDPDWLLIYELTSAELVLVRTGTHADLFE